MSLEQFKFKVYNFGRAEKLISHKCEPHMSIMVGSQPPPSSSGPVTFGAIWLCLFLSLLLFELHVPIVHHGPRQFVDPNFLLWAKTQDVNGILEGKKGTQGSFLCTI